MKRQEATNYLKTMLVECNLGLDAFLILDPSPNLDYEGYRVFFKGVLDKNSRDYAENLAEKSGLSVKQNPEGILVYRKKKTRQ